MSSLRALALLTALTLAPASAMAAPEESVAGVTYVFTAVDAYTAGAGHLVITGVLQGESTPRTIFFDAPAYDGSEANRCDRLALLAMTRPGRFHFSWFKEYPGAYPTCTLTRQ
ncbi:hypothetical protein D7W79_24955 [Corallococcus exercitus]|uniref:Uncharacterized protein n=1 Tax=Corallococcus exercitus TaxID=2316736 RepID=A0A3A8I7M4_9BACT|nr:hypothetical protein [Corallococcus exercitus]NOK37439.1 hypothetical protein [Corallococcus exercitus]RKG73673.1 hypothetical protein D7W79_24955 [Corallococcus exercitus]